MKNDILKLKTFNINVRVDTYTNDLINDYCYLTNMTASEFIRMLIYDYDNNYKNG